MSTVARPVLWNCKKQCLIQRNTCAEIYQGHGTEKVKGWGECWLLRRKQGVHELRSWRRLGYFYFYTWMHFRLVQKVESVLTVYIYSVYISASVCTRAGVCIVGSVAVFGNLNVDVHSHSYSAVMHAKCSWLAGADKGVALHMRVKRVPFPGHFRRAFWHVTAPQPTVINCLSAWTHLESVIRQHRFHNVVERSVWHF